MRRVNLPVKRSFTLVELLIIIGLIAILVAALIVLIDPLHQIYKSEDARRKSDLATLNKAMEDYYNDKGCYPKPEDICYDTPINICSGIGAFKTVQSKTCNICGFESTSPSFAPYLNQLPCDPKHPKSDYLYEVGISGCGTGGNCSAISCPSEYCPNWYRVYTNLAIDTDSESEDLGCLKGGCGLAPSQVPTPTPPYGYDYGMSSPNIALNKATQYNCITETGTCNVCGLYEWCLNDPGCPDEAKIYSSYTLCCSENPGGC